MLPNPQLSIFQITSITAVFQKDLELKDFQSFKKIVKNGRGPNGWLGAKIMQKT